MNMTAEARAYLESLSNRMSLRLSETEFAAADRFARLFLYRMNPLDLAQRDVHDDAGMCIDTWFQFRDRAPGSVQVQVVNPVHARDGWQSPHTVVRVMAPDMPFTVDSVLMTLSHDGLVTHLLNNVVFAVDRDSKGAINDLSLRQQHPSRELVIYAEIDHVPTESLESLKERLTKTCTDLSTVVEDFEPMKAQLLSIRENIASSPLPKEEVEESMAFLDWLSSHFTFLGYREFEYSDDIIRQSGEPLGVLRIRSRASERRMSEQPEFTRAFLLEPELLSFSKSGTRSRVHRPAYPDYVGIKRFDDEGKVIGEHGFLGLYTSRVYMESPNGIPVVRQKIANVIARSEFDPVGFDGKVLAQILATFPRDELFQIDEDDLLETTTAIANIHERRHIRVFARYESYGLFANCLVYLPKDLFDTRARTQIEGLLIETFDAVDAEYDIQLSESILVRLQFILRVRPGSRVDFKIGELEKEITDLVSDWSSELTTALTVAFGETQGRRHIREYADAFPAAYREAYSARSAADDVANIEQLSLEKNLLTQFYRRPEDTSGTLRLKIFHLGESLPLSDLIPQLENLGLRVIGEHPLRVRRASGPLVSIHDFDLVYDQPLVLSRVGERFEQAFVKVWDGLAENDSFNRLVLGAGLSWRQVSVLRAYARYVKQIRFGFSQDFISDTLDKHRSICSLLIQFFEARFDPELKGREPTCARLIEEISKQLEHVELLNEDRILRRFLELMNATLRTNFFQIEGAPQSNEAREHKPYVAFKIAPAEVPDMPRPLPMYEIFVCAPYFEGVHLRGGAIARGGLRWSDRLEDYRTEVLGLVKAQIVKNGVIVPTGAKGGFVLKSVRGDHRTRDVRGCYRHFISGLLDITDNIVQGGIVKPPCTICYDGDDTYLVVAADKGTATFSDEANDVAQTYNFWLGDAFASGGSNGYDHKEMGITAKGAWVSVQRHFMERGVDIQSESITVLGIGDMGGDVFGNGMLLSESIQLVAAFNHLHIFLDPNPDPATGFAERKRLFEQPGSTWGDYDTEVVSKGGGIYSRRQKSIELTPEVQARFGIEKIRLTPDELLHELLKAPVDLIWNGGIGTYVKSGSESHADVGDRSNDNVRVDAGELNSLAFGEGGNLGMTQRGRIEFALAGGSVNTDFIDNSAGVDCSDHEVNIKIALESVVATQDMTNKQRNLLLEQMTDTVSALVLDNNRRQVRSLSLASQHALERPDEYRRFMTRMEADNGLDRQLEFLPSDEEYAERVTQGSWLTRPELAVLLAYSKIFVKKSLVESDLHEDARVRKEVLGAFPAELVSRHEAVLLEHPLAREVLASQLANNLVDYMGITFVIHLMEFVGGTAGGVARAYLAFEESFELRTWFAELEALTDVPEESKLRTQLSLIRLGRRATRWIVRHKGELRDIEGFVASFKPRIHELIEARNVLMGQTASSEWMSAVEELTRLNVPEPLARRTALAPRLASALPIIEVADRMGVDATQVAGIFVTLSDELCLDWLNTQLGTLPTTSHWQSMERDSLLDDVTTYLGGLAGLVLDQNQGDAGAWISGHPDFTRNWHEVINDAQHALHQDFSMYSMTARKLSDLCRSL